MIKKKEFIWNTIGSIICSLLSAVLLMFCTRINGTTIAGMFSIAFATAYILNAVGDYGIRIYQVTDSKRRYSFGEYLFARFLVVGFMILIGIIFVFVSGYELEKLVFCILLILFKAIDNLSESYQAEFQLQGRLEIGGKSVVYRNLIAIIVFFMIDIITKNALIAAFFMLIANLIVFILYDLRWIKKFTKEKPKKDKDSLKNIIRDCTPLFGSTLLSMYLNNSVKYAIDRVSNYEMQTFYNIIYLPTYTINLISLFISKPLLRSFGELWNNKEYTKFKKIMIQLFMMLLVVTLAIEVVCFFIGIPILSFIYGVNIDCYKIELLILIASGFFYAMSSLLFYLLGAMRGQGKTVVSYVIASVFALIIPGFLVEKWGMMGAAISNIAINIILFISLMVSFLRDYKKKTK